MSAATTIFGCAIGARDQPPVPGRMNRPGICRGSSPRRDRAHVRRGWVFAAVLTGASRAGDQGRSPGRSTPRACVWVITRGAHQLGDRSGVFLKWIRPCCSRRIVGWRPARHLRAGQAPDASDSDLDAPGSRTRGVDASHRSQGAVAGDPLQRATRRRRRRWLAATATRMTPLWPNP